MQGGPPPCRSGAPAADRLWLCRALIQHRCGFVSRLPARPMLRSLPYRPVAADSYLLSWDALGPRAFHVHRETLATVGIGGNVRPAFPVIAAETAQAIDRWSVP